VSRDPMPMDWDDARITAAFHARFDVEPAPTLAARIVAELSPKRRPRWAFARRSSFAIVAVAFALVLVVVGVQTGVLPWLPQSASPTLAPSGQPTSTPAITSSPSSTPEPFPTQVKVKATGATLPVDAVADAITVRDGGVDSRELAVGGWYVFNVVPCPKTPNEASLLEECVLDFAWLMTAPEQLATGGTGQGSFREPSGPAIHAVIAYARDPAANSLFGSLADPVHVVFLGHFDDPDALKCSATMRQACADRFVVDELAWPSGPIARPTPTSVAGLTVESVPDALAARDQGGELAVTGWYQGALPQLTCPREWSYVVLQGCTKPYQFLMADPEAILEPTNGGGPGIHPPSGPGFGVTFDGFDSPTNPGHFNNPDGPTPPTQVVLIGHFHDRRAQICTDDIRTACDQQFMVDAVAWLGGFAPKVPFDVDLRDGSVPAPSGPQLQAIRGFAAGHPQYVILNTVEIGGDHAFELEPGITGDKSIDFAGVIWFVHAYDNGTPSSKTPAIFAIDPSGAAFTDGCSGWGPAGP